MNPGWRVWTGAAEYSLPWHESKIVYAGDNLFSTVQTLHSHLSHRRNVARLSQFCHFSHGYLHDKYRDELYTFGAIVQTFTARTRRVISTGSNHPYPRGHQLSVRSSHSASLQKPRLAEQTSASGLHRSFKLKTFKINNQFLSNLLVIRAPRRRLMISKFESLDQLRVSNDSDPFVCYKLWALCIKQFFKRYHSDGYYRVWKNYEQKH